MFTIQKPLRGGTFILFFIFCTSLLFGISFPQAFATSAVPECSITPGSGRIIVDLGANETVLNDGKIRSDNIYLSEYGPVSASIPAGTYNIILESYENHSEHPDTQTQEIWYAKLFDSDDNLVASTDSIDDLPNDQDSIIQTVNTDFVVSEPITSIEAKHAAFYTSGIHSIIPLCMAFEPVNPASIECPLTPASGRTIIDLMDPSTDPELLAHAGNAKSKFGPVPASLAPGTYDLTFVSYEEHSSQSPPLTQPAEQWHLELRNSSGSTVTQTNSISDLPTEDDFLTEQVHSGLVLSETITELLIQHSTYPDTNPNSIYALCAAFDEVTPPSCNAPVLDSNVSRTTTVSESFSYTVSANSGDVPITFTLDEDDLPDGLSFDGTTIAGTPTETGTFVIDITGDNVCGSDVLTLTIEVEDSYSSCTLSTLSLPSQRNGKVGNEYTYRINTDGPAPESITAEDLPNGLSLIGETITGIPQEEGLFTVRVTSKNSCGSDTETMLIVISENTSSGSRSSGSSCTSNDTIRLITPETHYLKVGQNFSYTITSDRGAIEKYYMTGIPNGFSLDEMTLSGAPTDVGTHQVGVHASNDCDSDSATITLIVTDVASSISYSSEISSVALSQLPETGSWLGLQTVQILLYSFIVIMISGAVVLIAVDPRKKHYALRRATYVKEKRRS